MRGSTRVLGGEGSGDGTTLERAKACRVLRRTLGSSVFSSPVRIRSFQATRESEKADVLEIDASKLVAGEAPQAGESNYRFATVELCAGVGPVFDQAVFQWAGF